MGRSHPDQLLNAYVAANAKLIATHVFIIAQQKSNINKRWIAPNGFTCPFRSVYGSEVHVTTKYSPAIVERILAADAGPKSEPMSADESMDHIQAVMRAIGVKTWTRTVGDVGV